MNPKFTFWLSIADELEALNHYLHTTQGPFALYPNMGQGYLMQVPSLIRERCAKGGWYWWHRGMLYGDASSALQTVERILGDCSPGQFEEVAVEETYRRIDHIRAMIDRIFKRS